ncbi:MAG TPA: DinB family protein [Puia sp.]|jgi:uncharacterized damage-inducible protein DinB|nr:DinB family protein [Puia sp.]
MNFPEQMARQLREVHFGGNWTSVNLKDSLADVDWRQATSKVYSLNTIAALVFHINYYVSAVLKVLQGGPLDAKDQYSFNLEPIRSPGDWEKLLDKTWTDARALAGLVEQLPETRLGETFAHEQYGNYYRNIQGVIEHTHYHLGQIVLIKKMLREN